LGVRYVLEGSVRKGGSRVRITAQLIDAETGTHLWADRFDGSLDDVFDLQDQIAINVAGIIEPTLQAAEIRRSAERPTRDLTAYDLYLRALPTLYFISKEGGQRTLGLLEQAIERDPDYAPALGAAALCGVWLGGSIEDRELNRQNAIGRAQRVLELAGDHPGSLIDAAYALAFFGEDIDAMTALVDRTLALHPSFALGWSLSANLRLWAGQPSIAIEHAEISRRLSPRNPVSVPSSFLVGLALFFKRRFDDAAMNLRVAIQERPNNPQFLRALASCYAHLGQFDEARDIVARLRSLNAVVLPPLAQFRNPEHRELFLSGLRLAAAEMV
jgi:tetratricopeptide (TPR) repeat protein